MSTLWMCKHPTFAFCRSETFDPASKPRRGNVYFSDKTTCATWYPTCDFCRPETFGPVSKQRIWNVYFQTKQILQLVACQRQKHGATGGRTDAIELDVWISGSNHLTCLWTNLLEMPMEEWMLWVSVGQNKITWWIKNKQPSADSVSIRFYSTNPIWISPTKGREISSSVYGLARFGQL